MVKVHDKVTFPFILNGNDYLHGFEGIKQNLTSNKQVIEQELVVVTRSPIAFNIDSDDKVPVSDDDTIMVDANNNGMSPVVT